MLRAVELKTEYMTNPLGVHSLHPRFSWQLAGTGKYQTAYRIRVVSADGGKGWDSGKVDGADCSGIRFEGKELSSREQLRWQVQLWDENDEEGPWSKEASFEMGLLGRDDWSAWWIGAGIDQKADDSLVKKEKKKKVRPGADVFSREFRVMNMPQRARLYLAVCGVCEVRLNGRPLGNERLLGGCRDSLKRPDYMVWDVLPKLITGTNRLEIVLGGGWYTKNRYGKEPMVLAQLDMTDRLGDRVSLCTDRSFRWSRDGATEQNDIYGGETAFCGRLPSLSGKARIIDRPVDPICILHPHICARRQLTPTLITTPSGASVLDFGENVSAVIAFRGRGEAGQKLHLCFSEYLEDSGEFPKFRPGHPKQQLTLHLSGFEDSYCQRLSFACFRYALAENLGDVSPEAFTAIVLSSDIEYKNTFTCSDERLNTLFDNAKRSMESAFLDAPFASPATDRCCSAADALAFFESSVSIGYAAPFWRKWLMDLEDAQLESGAYPLYAPGAARRFPRLRDGNPALCGAGVLLTWRLWKHSDDRELLIQMYPSMRRYAYFLMRKSFRIPLFAYLRKNPWEQYTMDTIPGRCELLEPEEESPEGALRDLFPHTEEATAWFAAVMAAMSDMAHELGNGPDRRLFGEYADGAKKAYNWLYARKHRFRPRKIAKQLLPLGLGLLDKSADAAALRLLLKGLKKRNFHAAAGICTTAMLLPELTSRGHTEEAYRVLLNEEDPGWLSQIKNGATSVWENWYGRDVQARPAGSRSRYAFGSAAQWLMQDCVGIRQHGPRHFLLHPHPGGGLRFAKGSFESLYGTVELQWQALYNGWTFEATVPPGTTAELHLPDGSVRMLEGGHHFFGV